MGKRVISLNSSVRLSDNNFTDYYKNICEYAMPLVDENVLSLTLRGPDDKFYRLKLDDNFRLTLVEHMDARQVDYLISGTTYYYINDDNEPYLTSSTNVENGKVAGNLRTVSIDDGKKYNILVENGGVVFKLYEGTTIDEQEAKYLISNNGNIYSFKIIGSQVFLERTTTETMAANIR